MKPTTLLPAAALLLLAACADNATAPDPAGLTAEEAAALAADYDAVVADLIDGLVAPAFSVQAAGGAPRAAVTVDETFTRTRTCPLGGSVTVEGRVTGTVDREARTMSRVTDAVRTESGCTFRSRRGDATLTLNGNPSTAIHAEGGIVNGVRQVRTMTQKGAFTFQRSTGQSGACDVDLTSTFDPATGIHKVVGTVCGRAVSVEHQHGGGGHGQP